METATRTNGVVKARTRARRRMRTWGRTRKTRMGMEKRRTREKTERSRRRTRRKAKETTIGGKRWGAKGQGGDETVKRYEKGSNEIAYQSRS